MSGTTLSSATNKPHCVGASAAAAAVAQPSQPASGSPATAAAGNVFVARIQFLPPTFTRSSGYHIVVSEHSAGEGAFEKTQNITQGLSPSASGRAPFMSPLFTASPTPAKAAPVLPSIPETAAAQVQAVLPPTNDAHFSSCLRVGVACAVNGRYDLAVRYFLQVSFKKAPDYLLSYKPLALYRLMLASFLNQKHEQEALLIKICMVEYLGVMQPNCRTFCLQVVKEVLAMNNANTNKTAVLAFQRVGALDDPEFFALLKPIVYAK